MKRRVLISAIVVVLVLSIIGCTACGLFGNKKFDEVVRCAKVTRDLVDDETFEIAGRCGYIDGWEDEDGYYFDNVFIAIQFSIIDANGEMVEEVALFVDGEFVGYFYKDYGEGDENANYKKWDDERKLNFLASSLIYIDGYYDKVYEKEEIAAELAKDAPSASDSGEAEAE